MHDRWDSTKGRYVTYDYEPVGDRFTRGLSELPRVYVTRSHTDTGHSYKRRVRTNEARCLTVSSVKQCLPAKVRDNLEDHSVYLRVDTPILFSRTPPGLEVGFEVTEQHKGRRHWFVCVDCEQRVGKLYAVVHSYWPVQWGCQKCLGLSYPSQAQHKTRARDLAIANGQIEVSFAETIRAFNRERRRLAKLSTSVDRLVSKFI